MMTLSVGVLSYVHYQGMKRYATQTLVTELGSEAYVIKENLRNELEALTGGLRLLTGHETIIKGVNSLFYSNQVAERFESFTNRYTLVSSMYLLTAMDGCAKTLAARSVPSSATLKSRN